MHSKQNFIMKGWVSVQASNYRKLRKNIMKKFLWTIFEIYNDNKTVSQISISEKSLRKWLNLENSTEIQLFLINNRSHLRTQL